MDEEPSEGGGGGVPLWFGVGDVRDGGQCEDGLDNVGLKFLEVSTVGLGEVIVEPIAEGGRVGGVVGFDEVEGGWPGLVIDSLWNLVLIWV